MIDNYLRTSLIFYDLAEKQDFRKKVLENVHIPRIQLTERFRLPPFNITSTDLIGIPTTFALYDKHTDIATADLLAAVYGGGDLLSNEFDGTDYWLIYNGETNLGAAMPTGDYYVVLSDGMRTWESETIRICECKENDYMGDFVFLANGNNGLEVYSVDNDGLFTHIDNDDQGGQYLDAWADINFVYATSTLGGFNILVYSVSGTGILTFLDNAGIGAGQGYGVWSDGKFIYLANSARGIEVYSVSDLGILTHIDNDFQGDTALGVWGDGNFIYVANGNGGLDVYSVSDAGILTHLDNDDQGASARGVWGDGNFIYLANSGNGIEVYSVSDVGILTHLDNDAQGGCSVYNVWGDGNFIYVADFNRGLDVYSVSLGILTHLDNDDPGGNGFDIRGDDNFVYLANAARGIESYSVSDLGILTHIDNDFIAANGIGVFANEKSHCTPKGSKITIEYENKHDFAGILSQAGYKGRVHLCADIRKPDQKIIKSGIERDGENWIQKIITQKIYRFNILCTESLIDTLTIIPSYETITVYFDNESAEVKEFNVAPPEWKYEGLGQLEISFIVETIIKTNCDEDYVLQEELILNGDFSAWTGAYPNRNPDDWTVGEVAPAEISEVAPNQSHADAGVDAGEACNIFSGGTDVNMSPTIPILIIGEVYLIEIEVTNVVGGIIRVRCGNTSPWILMSTLGIHRFIQTASGSTDFFFYSSGADITIDNVSVKLYS